MKIVCVFLVVLAALVLPSSGETTEYGVTTSEGELTGPLKDCLQEFERCFESAIGVVKPLCIVKLGECVAANVAKCAFDCIKPSIGCSMHHITNPVELVKCWTIKFVGCVSEHCENATETSTLEKLPTTELSMLGETPVDQCIKEEVDCMLKKPLLQKYTCVLEAAKCLYTAVKECGWPCIGQTIKCALSHLLNPIARLKCYTVELLVCIDDHCTDYDAPSAAQLPQLTATIPEPQQVSVVPNDLPIEKCLREEDACFARLPLLRQFQCVIEMGTCLTVSLAKCGIKCIPATIKCALSNLLSPARRLKCYTSGLATCVHDECDHKTLAPPKTVPEVAPTPSGVSVIPKDLPIEECLAAENKCLAETKLLFKFKCVLQCGHCLITKIAKCGIKCIPATISCAISHILHPIERLECYTSKLAKCVDENCDHKKTTVAPPPPPKPTASPKDIVVLPRDLPIEECLDAENKCLAETKLIFKFKCVLQCGHCLVTKIAKCGLKCIPATISCAISHILHPIERLECYTSKLAKCVDENCDHKKTTVAPPPPPKPTASPKEMTILSKDWYPWTSCLDNEAVCVKGASLIQDKVKCIVNLGKCLANKFAGTCEYKCITPTVSCATKNMLIPFEQHDCYLAIAQCVEHTCN